MGRDERQGGFCCCVRWLAGAASGRTSSPAPVGRPAPQLPLPQPHLAALSAPTSRDPGLYLVGRGQLHTCQCRWPGLTPGPFSSDTQARNSGAPGGQRPEVPSGLGSGLRGLFKQV